MQKLQADIGPTDRPLSPALPPLRVRIFFLLSRVDLILDKIEGVVEVIDIFWDVDVICLFGDFFYLFEQEVDLEGGLGFSFRLDIGISLLVLVLCVCGVAGLADV